MIFTKRNSITSLQQKQSKKNYSSPTLSELSQKNDKRTLFTFNLVFVLALVLLGTNAFNFFLRFLRSFSFSRMNAADAADLERIPAFLTDTPKLEKIKQYVNYDRLSTQQKWFIYLIFEENYSRRKVQAIWAQVFGAISKDALSTCAKRTAFSLYWRKGETSNGKVDYLTPDDLEYLKQIIKERAELHNALDTVSVLDEAQKLKTERLRKAVEFLRLIRSDGLAQQLDDMNVPKPSRSWTNNILYLLDAHFEKPRLIDGRRFLAVSYDSIASYFNKFGKFIRQFDKLLIITTDGTMMQSSGNLKVIVPNDLGTTYTSEKLPDLPHITAMCTTSIVGAKPPLFIIIKDRQTMPHELKDLVDSGQVAIASTKSGWMDRWCFLLWSFHLVSWVVNYRQTLPSNLREKKILLILDGHTSRENPIALEYLSCYNIEVLVLPGHCTHVLQLFDVGLAGALKEKFGIILQRNLKNPKMYTERVMAENVRKIVIESFLEAWNQVCNKHNCEAAARITGTYPVDPDAPRQTGFLKDLTAAEKARLDEMERRKAQRLDINCSIITQPDKIDQIRETVKRNRDDADLAKPLSEFPNFSEFCRFYFKRARENSVLMLSRPIPCAGFCFDEFWQP